MKILSLSNKNRVLSVFPMKNYLVVKILRWTETLISFRRLSFIPEKSRILKGGKIMKTKLLALLLGNLMAVGALLAEDREGDDNRKDQPTPREGDRDGDQPRFR
ncbi:MAG: hypothetical protein AAEJ57_00225, partial [Opitutales bacterium]